MRFMILAVVVFSLSCDLFKNEQVVPDEFVGEWNWVRTSGPWMTIDADTAGYTMQLNVYHSDRAEWFRADTLLAEFKITLREDDDGDDDRFILIRVAEDQPQGCSYGMRQYMPQTLTIYIPDCTDGPSYYFER